MPHADSLFAGRRAMALRCLCHVRSRLGRDSSGAVGSQVEDIIGRDCQALLTGPYR